MGCCSSGIKWAFLEQCLYVETQGCEDSSGWGAVANVYGGT